MKTGLQFIRFGLVGVVNTLAHYTVFVLLFRLVGLEMMVASGLGYFAGIVTSFFLNRKWTFKVAGTKQREEFAKFVCVNIVSLGVNLFVLKMLVDLLGVLPEIAQFCAIAASILINFAGNKWWTFRQSVDRVATNY